MADAVGVDVEIGAKRLALVEDHAAALPMWRPGRPFEVAQDAAVELVHMRNALLRHPQRGFFAAYAAGAVADHGLACQLLAVRFERGGKAPETAQLPVQRAFEAAGLHLESVARVEHRHGSAFVAVALVEPASQRAAVDGGCAAGLWAHAELVHADDLALQLDQQPLEGRGFGALRFEFERGESRVGLQRRQPLLHRRRSACQRQVDALGRQQHGALQGQRLGMRQQPHAQRRAVVNIDKTIGSDDGEGSHGIRL